MPPMEDLAQYTSLFQEIADNVRAVVASNDIETWVRCLIALGGGFIIGRFVALMMNGLAGRLQKRGRPGRAQVLRDLAGPISLGFLTFGLSTALGILHITQGQRDFGYQCVQLLIYVVIFWFLFNLVSIFGLIVKRISRKKESSLDRELAPLVERCARICLLIVAVLVVCKSVFHKDIGAWLAGFGIAGLAFSLAAQDSLKHLFGSVTLLLDRPFAIGDRVVSCGIDGRIEDIGFRSTKIRTPAGHLVTIPNANVVNGMVENVSRRPAVRRVINLTIPGNTRSDRLRQAVKALTAVFEEEDIRGPVRPVVNGSVRMPQVRFEDILPENYKFTITYWYAPANDPGRDDHTERVNLRIVESLQEVGIRGGSQAVAG